MGLKWKILPTVIFIVSFSLFSNASWQGPLPVISGTWGDGVGQFGLDQGDSGDTFPLIEAITPDNKIVITDMVNKKQMVFSSDGNLIKEVKWMIKSQSGGRTYYDISEYSFGPVAGYSQDGNIYTGTGGKYFLKSSTGLVIKTYTERPTELGKVKSEKLGENNYKITVTYSNKVYGLTSDRKFTRYSRDVNGFVYGANAGGVWKFNQCGRVIGTVFMPAAQRQETARPGNGENIVTANAEYGDPVIAPNGEVYTWKRTPDTYSILKWTWVDDPNVPTGPDAPSGLSVMPSTTGIYLTWTASPQDPGCVTGYEVSRATSAGGVGTAVATVNAGVLKYNDTSATAGTTYYYKVRAVAGSEYSPYTVETSAKRP